MTEVIRPEGSPREVDWVMLGATLALFALGLLAIVSASTGTRRAAADYPMRQFLFGLAAAGVYWGILKVGYARILKWAYPIYWGVLLVLAAVFLIGHAAKGAQSWFALGSFRLQPSELGKVALALVLARHGSRYPPDTPARLALFLGLGGASALLVLLQPDLGSTLVYGVMLLSGLWISGAPGRYLAGLSAAGLAVLPLAWGVLKEYQRLRLLVFLNPQIDPLGAGYNVIQSRIAVGSGGLLGKGFLSGTQGRLHFLPEPHTDFIFSVFAEEFGFVGSITVLALFALLLWRILRAGIACPDIQAKTLCSAVAAWIAFQTFESVAMSMGLAPITGLPLPLFSYGGSSLLAEGIALGLVQSVAVTAKRARFD
jgi:rod shape determining protein RodA